MDGWFAEGDNAAGTHDPGLFACAPPKVLWYTLNMVKLTEEQRAALQQQPDGVACRDVASQRVYFLVDSEIHQRAMHALKQQQDLEAIREGVRQMEAGGGTPIAEARAELAAEFGFSTRP